MPISWLSQQEAEGTEMALLQPTRLPRGWPQSIHMNGYSQGQLGIIPDVFVATKTGISSLDVRPSPPMIVATKKGTCKLNHDVSLTLTKSFFVPKPNQSISTELWQEGNRKFDLNKQKVATQLFSGFAEMYLANIYSGDWVGHRFAHSLVRFMHKDHRFKKTPCFDFSWFWLHKQLDIPQIKKKDRMLFSLTQQKYVLTSHLKNPVVTNIETQPPTVDSQLAAVSPSCHPTTILTCKSIHIHVISTWYDMYKCW